jgi:hypothetical protein
MKHIKLFEDFINETETLVHVYQDGELYGTGSLLKKKGNKALVSFDSEDERWFDNKDVKLVESETVYHIYDFLGMQAQLANMTREEWIAHYGSPEIGTGIDE